MPLRRIIAPILLLLLLLPLTACGKKGPVRPKLQPLPAAPAALTIEQRGEGFLLSWGIPATNQDGTPLADLAGFRVERLRYAADEECLECLDRFEPVTRLDLDYLQQARRLGDRLYWWDFEPAPGSGYAYRVTALTGGGRAGAPARENRLLLPVPPPPQNLTATAHDRMVRLAWEPPAAAAVPGTLAGWNVYRWQPGAPPPLRPVNASPLTETSYQDFGLENGRTYLYAVTTVSEQLGLPAESPPAEPAEVIPVAGK